MIRNTNTDFILYCVVPIILIILGYIVWSLFNLDTLWRWHVNRLKQAGISEKSIVRTDEWEMSVTVKAIFALVFFGCGLCFMLSRLSY